MLISLRRRAPSAQRRVRLMVVTNAESPRAAPEGLQVVNTGQAGTLEGIAQRRRPDGARLDTGAAQPPVSPIQHLAPPRRIGVVRKADGDRRAGTVLDHVP